MRKYQRKLWRATFGGGSFKHRNENSWRIFHGLPPVKRPQGHNLPIT